MVAYKCLGLLSKARLVTPGWPQNDYAVPLAAPSREA